jgi:hypothetical protein
MICAATVRPGHRRVRSDAALVQQARAVNQAAFAEAIALALRQKLVG